MITILNILSALPAIVKIIFELMDAAEKALGSGTGPDKKATVMQALEAMVADSDLWSKVGALFSGIINMIALCRFGSKI